MPEDSSKRKRRSQRDIERFWDKRYGAFLRDGFTDEEAKWGADHGLSLSSKEVKSLRRHRRALVTFYMDAPYYYPRVKAIEMAAQDLEQKLEDAGIRGKNLFYEVSP